ncbi:hypothetical protein, partial [Streptococcus sobrinus]|uniref:hypothetical protein n=1 Tax=Streptococcus sobrinus TaxID=1310 RepID=UPI001C3FC9A6
ASFQNLSDKIISQALANVSKNKGWQGAIAKARIQGILKLNTPTSLCKKIKPVSKSNTSSPAFLFYLGMLNGFVSC